MKHIGTSILTAGSYSQQSHVSQFPPESLSVSEIIRFVNSKVYIFIEHDITYLMTNIILQTSIVCAEIVFINCNISWISPACLMRPISRFGFSLLTLKWRKLYGKLLVCTKEKQWLMHGFVFVPNRCKCFGFPRILKPREAMALVTLSIVFIS